MELLIYRLIRVPVISVRYLLLNKNMFSMILYGLPKNIKCTFTGFIYSCLYSFHHKVLLAKFSQTFGQRRLEKPLLSLEARQPKQRKRTENHFQETYEIIK